MNLERKKFPIQLRSISDAIAALDALFEYTVETLNALQKVAVQGLKIPFETSWGQLFDCELMIEHAIIHFLQHQHQIDKILNTKSSDPTK